MADLSRIRIDHAITAKIWQAGIIIFYGQSVHKMRFLRSSITKRFFHKTSSAKMAYLTTSHEIWKFTPTEEIISHVAKLGGKYGTEVWNIFIPMSDCEISIYYVESIF